MSDTISQVDLLARILDVASLRQRTLAHNIANVNTPDYIRLEVAFEEELADRIRAGGSTEALQVKPQVVEGGSDALRADGNNVSLEQEMTDLNKNALLYSAAAQFLATKLAMLRSAASGQ